MPPCGAAVAMPSCGPRPAYKRPAEVTQAAAAVFADERGASCCRCMGELCLLLDYIQLACQRVHLLRTSFVVPFIFEKPCEIASDPCTRSSLVELSETCVWMVYRCHSWVPCLIVTRESSTRIFKAYLFSFGYQAAGILFLPLSQTRATHGAHVLLRKGMRY